MAARERVAERNRAGIGRAAPEAIARGVRAALRDDPAYLERVRARALANAAALRRVVAELLVLALLGVSLLAEQPLVIGQADALGDAMPAAPGLSETVRQGGEWRWRLLDLLVAVRSIPLLDVGSLTDATR